MEGFDGLVGCREVGMGEKCIVEVFVRRGLWWIEGGMKMEEVLMLLVCELVMVKL